MFSYVWFSVIFGIGCLVLFGLLQWLNIPAGHLVDWMVGIASFWWLLVIITVPWNIYFDAKEVISEANLSKEKDIKFDKKQLDYAKRIQKWSIWGAIGLHLISAVALYVLADTGISPVGYVSAGATLLLTCLRPAIRGYQYVALRLSLIREQIKYPREDVVELRYRFNTLENQMQYVLDQLSAEKEESIVSIQQREWKDIRHEMSKLRATVEQLQANNQLQHEELSREARNSIAQLTEDGQVLNHVREIIRFFKTA